MASTAASSVESTTQRPPSVRVRRHAESAPSDGNPQQQRISVRSDGSGCMTSLYAIPEVSVLSRDMLICPSCGLRFVEPKRLPCGHTLCTPCLLRLVHHGGCPIEKRCECTLPDDVTQLPSNVTATVLSNKNPPNVNRCPECGEMTAVLRHCINHCDKFICMRCLYRHDDDVTMSMRSTVREIRRKVAALTEQKIRWESQLENLCTQYEDAKIRLDQMFNDCRRILDQKHEERRTHLDHVVQPYLAKVKRDIRHAIKVTANSDSLLADMRRMADGKDSSQLTILRTRLRCLATLAQLETTSTTFQNDETVRDRFYRQNCVIHAISVADSQERFKRLVQECYHDNIKITYE